MAETLRHFRIFISSPGDVSEERELVLKIIDNIAYDPAWKERVTLEAVAWDKKGAPLLARMTPQEAVNLGLRLPSECDIVIVIFWTKMGTPLPFPEYRKEKGEPYLSGTEWEYEDAIKSAKATAYPEVIVYRRTEVPSWPPTDPDIMKKIEQWNQVQTFFSHFSEEGTGAGIGGYNSYSKASDFEELLETHLKYVLERLLKSPPRPPKIEKVEPESVDKTPVWQGSPFPGLRAFTTADEPIYFGRGRETAALMQRVATQGFVAVVGASGSGKSSLVGAGLIPKLKAGGLEGSASWILPEFKDGQWVGLRFTPGEVSDNPFTALAVKCAPMHGLKPAKLAEQLESDPKALRELCLKALAGRPDTAKVLIFIDQFEELFTVVAEKYREPFIKMLAEAASEPRLRVVVTTRSDFYDRCVEWQVLTDLLENGSFPLSTPDAFFLKDMIELPAERAGLTFEEGLPAQMVRDTGSDAGALALLAFALDELYKAGELTQAAYEKLGKVEGAIGTRAAAIYSELKPDVQAALPEVFTKLVTVNVEGTPTRRRAALSEFPADSVAGQLISALVEARLLVSDKDSVEVAHEALFRKWPTLTEWIAEYKNDLYTVEQVKQAAKEWQINRYRETFLWSHDRLEPIYEAIKKLGINLDLLTSQFVKPEAKRLLEKSRTAENEFERRVIISDLGRIGESSLPEIIEVLLFHVDDIDFDAITDIHSLLRKYHDKAISMLHPWLNHNSAEVCHQATIALGKLGDQSVFEPLISLLQTGEPILRSGAVETLGDLGDKRAISYLIEALNDEYSLVRWRSAVVLGNFQAQQAVIPIESVMLEDEDSSVRSHCAEALGKIGDISAAPSLGLMLNDQTAEVRLAAITALGKIKATSLVDSLGRSALTDKDIRVRMAAVFALGDIGDDLSSKILSEICIDINNTDESLRATAIHSLSNRHNEALIPIFVQALKDVSPWVREHAINAIGIFGKTSLLKDLIMMLDDVDEDVRFATESVLEEIGTPEALEAVADWRAKHPEE